MRVPHPHVPHPADLIPTAQGWTGRFNDLVGRVANNTLGSMALFWLCFVVPLVTIPAPDNVKLIISILFSSWFQAWALPVLQNGQNRAETQRSAKADADHEALTALSHRVDEIHAAVTAPPKRMRSTPKPGGLS